MHHNESLNQPSGLLGGRVAGGQRVWVGRGRGGGGRGRRLGRVEIGPGGSTSGGEEGGA